MEKSRFRGYHYRTGQLIEIECEQGKISHIQELSVDHNFTSCNEQTPIIAPGLVDLQVNGYGGIDFNKDDLTCEQLQQLVEMQWALGVTSLLPTIITNTPEAIHTLLHNIDEQLKLVHSEVEHTIVGIHLEGPFISAEDGPRGAHPLSCVIPPNIELLQQWQAASGHRLRIITFSPEWDESVRLVEWCAKEQIIASIGHTAANSEQIKQAVKAGATLSTHLGNGTHPLLPRHPNYMLEQLAHDELTACVISDGFHLSDQVLRVFYRAKQGKLIIVSDAVALAGMPPGQYNAAVGGAVILSEDGRLCLEDDQRLLAGSALSLKAGLEHFIALNICPWQDAWDMASVIPAQKIKLQNDLEIGSQADFVLMHMYEHKPNIVQTVKHGTVVWQQT